MIRYCIAGRHVVHDGVFCELCPGPLSFDGRRCTASKCKALSGKHAVTCAKCGSGGLTGYAPSVRLGATVAVAAWLLAAVILRALVGPAALMAASLGRRFGQLACPALCAAYRVAADAVVLFAISFMFGETGGKLRSLAARAARTGWHWAFAATIVGLRLAWMLLRLLNQVVAGNRHQASEGHNNNPK